MRDDKGASWVADARRLWQDFVAPEMRAITARLDSTDKQDAERDKIAAERHATLLASNQERDKIAAERHTALLDRMESWRREIMLQLELAITKSKLEEQQASRSQSAQAPQ